MLRKALLVLALLLLAAGIWMSFAGDAQGHALAAWGAVLTLAVLFENWRYRRQHGALDGGWVRTDERFEDPVTGEALEVWYQPGTGERRYEKSRR